ncbi:probable CCR4-associated factor 1 homolog 11 [Oryza glaberrima]|uniref:probable CCR4-associated factor 1 homolog 11 n=1 Tax=Oryza glaberrima TaxID=4538 RepID=UPI00224C5A4D|nr:probable CCR4-associated factor 1 homolog 11 [Oryza glaberrima]
MPMMLPAAPVVTVAGVEVRPVWANNLNYELGLMQHVAADAICAAVNVHYPGVVHGAGRDQASLTAEQRYADLKRNVDELKPLQVGLAVHNARGHRVAWEFNLRDFDLAAGDAHTARSLGLVARPGLRWVAYSGAYHVAYLLKVITGGAPLPPTVVGFLAAARHLLGPDMYDVARVAADFHGGPVGLDMIASRLGIPPPLTSPMLAGAAAVRAIEAFVELMHRFGGDVAAYKGLLQGLQVT